MSRRPDGKLTAETFPGETAQDECGVFGVWAPGEEVAKLTFYGLYALQHRGQESAGIATTIRPGVSARSSAATFLSKVTVAPTPERITISEIEAAKPPLEIS